MRHATGRGANRWLGFCLVVCLSLPAWPSRASEGARVAQGAPVLQLEAHGVLGQARALRAAGEYSGAIKILRAGLRARPDDVALREELGYTLILDRQMAAAQYQFEILAERNRDPGLNTLYRSVLNRIVAERPFGVSLIFGFTPSDNINQGTDNKTLENHVLGTGIIDPSNRRISGWSSRIGLKGYARTTLSPRDLVVLDWRAEREFFSTQLAPQNDLELGLTYSRFFPRAEVGLRGFHLSSQRATGDYTRTGVSFFGSYDIDRRRRIDGRLQLSDLDVVGVNGADGRRVLLDAGYLLTPRPALAFRFGVQVERANARAVVQRYTSIAATLRASKALRNGIEVSGQANLGKRRFNSLLGFARRDSFADVSVTVFNSKFSYRGVVPKLTCRMGKTSSNVALFEARTRACAIDLSRRF